MESLTVEANPFDMVEYEEEDTKDGIKMEDTFDDENSSSTIPSEDNQEIIREGVKAEALEEFQQNQMQKMPSSTEQVLEDIQEKEINETASPKQQVLEDIHENHLGELENEEEFQEKQTDEIAV